MTHNEVSKIPYLERYWVLGDPQTMCAVDFGTLEDAREYAIRIVMEHKRCLQAEISRNDQVIERVAA